MYCASHGVQQTIGITANIDKLNECVAQPNRARALEPLIEVVPKVYGQGCHNGVRPGCQQACKILSVPRHSFSFRLVLKGQTGFCGIQVPNIHVSFDVRVLPKLQVSTFNKIS